MLAALEAANVKHVFWLTLRAAHHPYVGMNDEIVAAAAKHPEVTVIDWNVYSRSHPEWFQDDGLHMLVGRCGGDGGPDPSEAARGGHRRAAAARRDDGAAGRPARPAVLRAAARGRRDAPYAWSLTGRLPAGLRLRASGAARRHAACDRHDRHVHVHRPGQGRQRPGRAPESCCSGCDAERRRAVLFPTVTFALFFAVVLPVSWAAAAAPARLARLDPARELRLLRLVGLAVRLPARRVDRRQPRPRRRDLPHAAAARAQAAARARARRSTSGCSATSSTRTSSSARSTTPIGTSWIADVVAAGRHLLLHVHGDLVRRRHLPRRARAGVASRASRSSRRSSRISSPARSSARASCCRSSSRRATRGGSTSRARSS